MQCKGDNGEVLIEGTTVTIRRGGFRIVFNQNDTPSKTFDITDIGDLILKRPGLLANGYLRFIIEGETVINQRLFHAPTNPNTILYSFGQRRAFHDLYAALQTPRAAGEALWKH